MGLRPEKITEIVRAKKSFGSAPILWKALPFLMPAFFITTTIIGAVRWFSPVPLRDMWDGTIQFYVKRLQGAHWTPFLEQYNEHRIILSTILFWIDYHFFGGLSYFLILMNIVLMFALWFALCFAARALLGSNRHLAWMCSALVAVPCFSWLQVENITWGYQGMFYMAFLLPLLALLSMARWIHEPDRMLWFWTASILGVLSTITMANGLLALPLLIVMLAVSGYSNRFRMGSLLMVTAATFALWSFHYVVIHHPAAPINQLIEFLLMFIGAPLDLLFHFYPLTMLAGVAVIWSCVYLALQWLHGRTNDPTYVALILFIVYVGGAAAAVSLARIDFGIGYALQSRYETPVVLLYSTLLLLFAHLYQDCISTTAVVKTLSVVVPVVLIATQWGTIDGPGPEIARQNMQSALALDLGIDDWEAIGRVYTVSTAERRELIMREAKNGVRDNLSVFALPELRLPREMIGKPSFGLAPCHGYIDRIEQIPGNGSYLRVSGWVFDEASKTVPRVAFVISYGIVTGAVLTGIDRPDVRKSIDARAVRSGFQGYTQKTDPKNISIYCKPVTRKP